MALVGLLVGVVGGCWGLLGVWCACMYICVRSRQFLLLTLIVLFLLFFFWKKNHSPHHDHQAEYDAGFMPIATPDVNSNVIQVENALEQDYANDPPNAPDVDEADYEVPKPKPSKNKIL